MAYSDKYVKGAIGYNSWGWPLIIMERARSEKPGTPVLCEVWGLEHECGSVYIEQIDLASDMKLWEEAIAQNNGSVNDRYFEGELIVKR